MEQIKIEDLHAGICEKYILAGQLEKAIDYCISNRVDPPQCSLTAQSANADKLRALCKNILSDSKWWGRRLKIVAARDAEMNKMNPICIHVHRFDRGVYGWEIESYDSEVGFRSVAGCLLAAPLPGVAVEIVYCAVSVGTFSVADIENNPAGVADQIMARYSSQVN